MTSFSNYRMERRPRSELTTGLVLYGENEPAEEQIDKLWKIVDRRTGEELTEPKGDFSEFSMGDKLYPAMMEPAVKRKWDIKQTELKQLKSDFKHLKRKIHAEFMQKNPDLPVVRKLKNTTYGRELETEFGSKKRRVSKQNFNANTTNDNDLSATDTSLRSQTIQLNSKGLIDNLEGAQFYWTVHPNPGACDKCQDMADEVFRQEPERPHPNCKCQIQRHAIVPKNKDLKEEDKRDPEPIHPPQSDKEGVSKLPPIDEIRINNNNHTFDIYSKGKLIKRKRVTSGRPGVTDPSIRDKGPTPPGKYYVDPKEISIPSTARFIGRWLRYGADWGWGRVPMHPAEETDTKGRDGFFIHGGYFDGSAGCQDIGSYDDEFFEHLQQSEGLIPVWIE